MLMIMAFFTGWKILAGMTGTSEHPEVMNLLLADKLAPTFWIGEVVLAVILPLVLYFALRNRKTMGGLALMGGIGLIGLFCTLYNMVIAGQLIPRFAQYNIYGMPRYLSYTPSLHEVMMFAGAVFLVVTLTIAGELYFRPGHARLLNRP